MCFSLRYSRLCQLKEPPALLPTQVQLSQAWQSPGTQPCTVPCTSGLQGILLCTQLLPCFPPGTQTHTVLVLANCATVTSPQHQHLQGHRAGNCQSCSSYTALGTPTLLGWPWEQPGQDIALCFGVWSTWCCACAPHGSWDAVSIPTPQQHSWLFQGGTNLALLGFEQPKAAQARSVNLPGIQS